MKRQRYGLLMTAGLLLLMLAFVPACSDDDDDVTTPQTQDPPTFGLTAENQIDLPATLPASDPNAAQVYAYAALANAFTSYTSFFAPPPAKAATDGPPWVYTWSINQPPEMEITFTLTVDETAEYNTWEYKVDGYDEDGTYDEFVFYSAMSAKDGSMGEMHIFDPDFSGVDPALSWDWSESVLGVTTMRMYNFDDGERIEFVVNADESGDLDVYEWYMDAWVMAEHYDWTALGNGSYVLYDTDGEELGSGSWNAGNPM